MKMMTRRSFLKITGAMVLAVGAAGALSSCGVVDDALNDLMDKNDVAGVAHNGVGVSWSGAYANRKDNEQIDTVIAYFDISSVSTKEYDLSASGIKLKVDGVEASVLPYEQAKTLVSSDEDLLLDKNNNAHIGKDGMESRNANGAVVFKLNNSPALTKWNKMELTISFGAGDFSFTATPKENDLYSAEIKANR